MTELLEKHTEVVDGERRWRADSELLGRYFNLHEYSYEQASSVQGRIFEVLKEMGFRATVYDHVLAIGDRDGEDSNLLGRVEIIWDARDQRFAVRNKKSSEEVYCLTEICNQIRGLWNGIVWEGSK